MPGTTDQRVVQLQFDNKDFEKNIEQSGKSLDKFKKELRFDDCIRGIEQFAMATRNITFDSIANNLQKLADKFTGLGTVSELVLSQLRRGIENVAAKMSSFIDSMTTQQMAAGMDKFEQLNKSVQTIKAATGETEDEVYSVLQRLNEYTDQTSYNFSDMAQNIGKFTSVGIDLRSAERQMEGIANWAARSGAGISEASRAMYNLSQAMGVGKLTLIDWKSIENAGMATKEFKQQLIDSAVAAGTLVKTIDKKTGKEIYQTAKSLGKQVQVSAENMGSTLNKAWATSNVLSATLEKYYWENLDPANQTAAEAILKLNDEQKETFQKMFEGGKTLDVKGWKALENMGVLTQETKQKIVDLAKSQGKLTEETDKDGKKIYKAVSKTGKEVTFTLDTLKESLSSGWFDKGLGDAVTSINDLAKSSFEAAQKCLSFTDVLNAWKDQLSTGWMNSYKSIFGELSESMEIFSNICNKVGDSLSELIEFRNGILQTWGDAGGRDTLWGLIIGEIAGEDGVAEAYEGIYGILDLIKDAGKMIGDGFKSFLMIFMDDSQKLIAQDEEHGAAFTMGWIASQLDRGIKNIQNVIAGVKNFFTEIPIGESESRGQKLQNIVNGIFSAFALAAMVLNDVRIFLTDFAGKLQPAFDAILKLFSALGVELYDSVDGMQKQDGLQVFFDNLLTTITPLTDGVNSLITAVSDLLIKLFTDGKENGSIQDALVEIGDAITQVAGFITTYGVPILTFFESLFQIVGSLFSGGFSGDNIEAAGNQVKTVFEGLLKSLLGDVPNLEGFLDGLTALVNPLIDLATVIGRLIAESAADGGVDNLFQTLGQVISFVSDVVSKVGKPILTFIGNLVSIIGDLVGGNLDGGITEVSDRLKAAFESLFRSLFGEIPELSGLADGLVSLIGPLTDLIATILKLLTESSEGDGIGGFFETLGKVISFVASIISKVGKPILTFVGTLIDVINDLLSGDINSDKLKSIGTKLETAFTSLFNDLINNLFGAGIGEKIQEFFAYIFGFSEESAVEGTENSEKTILGTVKLWLRKIFTGIRSIVDGFKGGQSLFGLLKERLGIGWFGSVLAQLGQLLQGTNIYQLITLFGKAFLIFKGISLARQGAAMFKGIKDFFGGLSDTLKSGLSIKFDDKAESLGDKLLKIAAAIALIAASILVLGNMKLEHLATGFGALVLILGLITGFLFILKKIVVKDWKDALGMVSTIIAIGAAIAGIALAIAVLIAAAKPIADMEWEQIAKMGAAIAGIGLILVVMTRLMKTSKKSKFFGGKSSSGVTNMLATALSLKILVDAFKPLAKMEWEELGKIGAGLVVFSGVLIGLSLLMSKTKKTPISSSGSLTNMLSAALSVLILVRAMMPLAKMEWEELGKIGAGLVVFSGVLVGMSLLMGRNTKGLIKGKSTLASMVATAASIWILVQAMMPLAKFTWEELGKIGAGLVVFSAVLVGISKLLGKNNSVLALSNSIGTAIMLIGVAGALYLAVQAMMPLAKMEWDELAKIGAGMAFILAAITLTVNSLKQVNILDSVGILIQLIGFAIILAVFASSMKKMKDVPFHSILSACIGISLILGAFGLIMKTLMPKGEILQGVHDLLALIGLAAVMLVFSIALNEIKDVPVDKVLAFSTGLAALMIGFGAALHVVKDLDLGSALKGILILAAAVAAIALVISLIAPLVIKSISGAFMDMMSQFELTAKMLVGFVSTMDSVQESSLTAAKRKFEILFSILETLGGSSAYYQGIFDFASCMLLLGSGLSQFQYSTDNITDPASSNAFKMIDKFVEVQPALQAFDIGDFANQALLFGTGLSLFQTATSDISSTEPPALNLLTALAGQADNISKFTELPLDAFKQQVAGLGGALSIYALGAKEATGIDGTIDPSDIESAVTLITSIGDAFSGENAFVVPDLPDEATLTNFGIELATLSASLIKFADASSGLGSGTDKALEILAFMRDLKTDLTKENLDVTKAFTDAGIMDDAPLVTFGVQIAALGTSLKNFNDSVKDFTKNQNVEDALSFFMSLKEKLNAESLKSIIIETFTGIETQDITDFGTEIGALGQALGHFASSTNFDESTKANFKSAIDSLDGLVAISGKLPQVGGIAGIIHGNVQTIGDISDDLNLLGSAMASFSQKLTGGEGELMFNSALVVESLKSVEALVDVALRLSSIDDSGIYQGYDWVYRVAQIFDGLTNMEFNPQDVQSPAQSIVAFMDDYRDAVEKVGGFDDTTIFTALNDVATSLSMLTAVNSENLDFVQVGKNIAIGIQNGIVEGQSGVVQAAVDVAVAAYTAAKQALDIQSPSRKFAELGMFASMGLAQGISDTDSEVEKAASGMAEHALNSADSTIAALSSMLLGDIGDNPTITPILDLSNIEAGSRQMNYLLGGSHSVGITPEVSTERAARYASMDGSATINQTGVTDFTGLYERMEQMGDRILELGDMMSRMKIVLNGNAIAGGITDDVDQNLGRQMFYAGRNN